MHEIENLEVSALSGNDSYLIYPLRKVLRYYRGLDHWRKVAQRFEKNMFLYIKIAQNLAESGIG